MNVEWYYVRGTRQSGPMSLEELRQRLAVDGDLAEALVWRKGFDTWRRAPEVEELYPPRQMSPPLPAVVAPEPSMRVTYTDNPTEPERKESGWRKAAGTAASIVGGLIGLALSKTIGATFWIPAIGVGGSWWLLTKCKARPALVPVLAIVVGHTFWILVAAAILLFINAATVENLTGAGLEIVMVGGVVAWVLKRQSLISIGALVVIEVFGFIALLVWTDFQTQTLMTAFAVHFVLRLAGTIAGIYAIIKLRGERIAAASVDSAGESARTQSASIT